MKLSVLDRSNNIVYMFNIPEYMSTSSISDFLSNNGLFGISPSDYMISKGEVYISLEGEHFIRFDNNTVMETDRTGGKFLVSNHIDVSKVDLKKELEEIECSFTNGGTFDGLIYTDISGIRYSRAELIASGRLTASEYDT